MHSKQQFQNSFSRTVSRAATAALAMAILFALTVVLAQSAQAQTFKVLHTFTGGADGGSPTAGVTMDKAGNLYGTASYDGSYGNGTVFKLSHKGSGWVFTPLYSFQALPDGASPGAAVVFGPDGSLYGTTYSGGLKDCGAYDQFTCGTVFNLRPQPTVCLTGPNSCPWTETVLYRFTGGRDGGLPTGLTFDPAGNMYSSTQAWPAIVKLEPSNGGWQETNFCGVSPGGNGVSGVILDAAGNLYGVDAGGGAYGQGFVFQLSMSGGVCTQNVLYSFQGGSDGINPIGSLIFDNVGNLYGTTYGGGEGGGGTVFKLTPSNGAWTFSLLYSFTGAHGPLASLTMDAAGNLYGTTLLEGAYGGGSVFKLTPSNGGWTETDLYDFTYGSDGGGPESNVIFDANGNLYGTASSAGYTGGNCFPGGCGTVWEITP